MGDFLGNNAFGLGLAAGIGTLWVVHKAATNDPDVTEDAADAIAVGAGLGIFTLTYGLLKLLK